MHITFSFCLLPSTLNLNCIVHPQTQELLLQKALVLAVWNVFNSRLQTVKRANLPLGICENFIT